MCEVLEANIDRHRVRLEHHRQTEENMLLAKPATFLALSLALFSVPALALTRIAPTSVLAGGPAFTLKGFADDEPFDPDERTLTWRRSGESRVTRLTTSKVGNRELRAEVSADLIAEPGEIFVGVDGVGGSKRLTIIPASERPVARDDYVTAYRNFELDIDVLANDLTTDQFDLRSVDITQNPGNGTVGTDRATGKVNYDPNPNFFGADSFAYTVEDSRGYLSEPATVHVMVKNEPPFTGCAFERRNKQLPIHHHALYHNTIRSLLRLETPLMGVRVKRDGVPLEDGAPVNIRSSREAFPGATGLPDSSEKDAQSGVAGAVDFAINPRVSGPMDETVFTATVTIDGEEHTCQGTVTAGPGVQLAPFFETLDSFSEQAAVPAGHSSGSWLPMTFEQSANGFMARRGGTQISLHPQGVTLPGGSGSMEFVGADAAVTGRVGDWLPGTSNYFAGSNPESWVTGVRQASKVRFDEVYPGIDLVYYVAGRTLEYDLIVSPGADPAQVRLRFRDLPQASLDESGDLLLETTDTALRLRKPFVYQEIDSERVEVSASYRVDPQGDVHFQLGAYNTERALVIDPILEFASYLGGSDNDTASDIALDAAGNIYVTGVTVSPGLATTTALQTGKQTGGIAGGDGYIAKFDPTGSTLLYLTYIGGSGDDAPFGIAIDSGGNVIVGGTTSSTDFPTSEAMQAEFGNAGDLVGLDAFILKLDSDGSALVYSTYLGGSGIEHVGGVAVDAQDNAYLAGATSSPDVPVVNAIQPVREGVKPFTLDALIAKLSAAGEPVYITYFGGVEDDSAYSIAPDASGKAWVVGTTASPDLPAVNAYQNVLRGGADVMVIQLDATGQSLLYSSYLGGTSDDIGYDAAVGSDGKLHVTGTTGSSEFPIVGGAQPATGNEAGLGTDAFVTKFSLDGTTLEYSTFFGGSGIELSHSIAVSADGSAYLAGETASVDLMVEGASQSASGGGHDGYVMKLSPSGDTVEYATYLGGSGHDGAIGIAVDTEGNAYVAGVAYSADFPVTRGAFLTAQTSEVDSFIAKLTPGEPGPAMISVSAASNSREYGLAPDSLAAGYGQALAPGVTVAALPWPVELAGTSVRVTDSEDNPHDAQIIVASPGQINYYIPPGVAAGVATITATTAGQVVATETARISPVAPSLFSADASGAGVAAAWFLRVAGDGTRTQKLIFDSNTREPVPVSLGNAGDQVYLLLFGTGLRGFAESATATIGGQAVTVAGPVPQPEFPGLDQANLGPLPASLAGAGEVDIVLSVDGLPANTVTVAVQ
jgi:uncharacterized protein (TIGR03437 family)